MSRNISPQLVSALFSVAHGAPHCAPLEPGPTRPHQSPMELLILLLSLPGLLSLQCGQLGEQPRPASQNSSLDRVATARLAALTRHRGRLGCS